MLYVKIVSSYNYDKVSQHALSLFFGIESANKKILEEVLKKTNNAERHLHNAHEIIQEFKKRGVSTIGSMMVPCPFDTDKSVQESLDYILKVNPDFTPVLTLGPNPGTPIMTEAIQIGSRSGILLGDYFEKYPFMDLDLLRPSNEWPVPPFKTNYNGEFINPFNITVKFGAQLIKNDIHLLSDEIVLMAYLHNNGLSKDQTERRKQCLSFAAECNKYLKQGDASSLQKVVDNINRNQKD